MSRPPDPRPPRLGTTDEILVEQPFLRRLALRLSRRSADADDLVQETLLRAYRARSRYQSGTSMRAWLATILRRLFMSQSMTETRRRTHADSDIGEPIAAAQDHAHGSADPARLGYDAALEQVDDRIRRAFVRLPQTYREPFVLFALDGLSYAEIASYLAIPVGTVMSRIHRAREQLRERAMSTTTGEIA